MAVDLRGRSLVSMRDLSREEILAILDLADLLKENRAAVRRRAPLTGRTLAMIFQKPSLRTRVSFEAGMTLLGGHAICLAPADIRLGERETTEDVARVLSRYVDLIMARVFGHEIVEELARHASVPVINGLSDFEHPCQILADLQTIRQRRGRLEGVKAAYVGDGNNVAHSLMLGAARVGMHLTVASPRGYEPKEPVLAEARRIAGAGGARIEVVNEPDAAVEDSEIIYTDVWASMGQESEISKRMEIFKDFQINPALLGRARADACVLHCLPAHYGQEITYEVARSPRSAIFDQAENRMHAQNALMLLLLDAAAV
jgi:ornithine carbamoyltransferase